MKNIKTLLFLTLVITSTVASAANPAPNRCLAQPSSKKYISSAFGAYPRKVIFECNYLCNAENKIYTVNAITNVTIRNTDEDAKKTVCQGVVVKKSSYGYEFDKVVSFYAPETNLKEIKKWAYDNINFNPKYNALEKAKLAQLKILIVNAGSAYIAGGISGSAATKYFITAGTAMSKIAAGLPMNPKKLDEAIKNLSAPKSISVNQSKNLVDTFIRTNASWRIPPAN